MEMEMETNDINEIQEIELPEQIIKKLEKIIEEKNKIIEEKNQEIQQLKLLLNI